MSLGSGRDSHLRETPLARAQGVVGWLVRAAQLEASSVRAFRELTPELVRHGARPSLLRAVRRAAVDEARHARVMRRLCRARGARVPPLAFAPARPRDAADLAAENVALGCVGELFGAAVARYQAEHAPAHDLRRACARIAGEEARHAALSFRMFVLLLPKLDAHARARTAQALAEAIAALHESLPPDASIRDELGLPDADALAALVASLEATSWAPLRRALERARDTRRAS
jgi:hypothetical protein